MASIALLSFREPRPAVLLQAAVAPLGRRHPPCEPATTQSLRGTGPLNDRVAKNVTLHDYAESWATVTARRARRLLWRRGTIVDSGRSDQDPAYAADIIAV